MPSLSRQQAREYFKELLKRKRQEMRPAIRRRSKNPLRGATWLYPWAVEREYSVYIRRIMKGFSDIAMPTVRENLQRWLEETSIFDGLDFMDGDVCEWAKSEPKDKSAEELRQVFLDFDDTHAEWSEEVMDEYDDEFSVLMADLRAEQEKVFVQEEDERKAEIFGYGMQVNNINRAQWSKITTLAIGTAFDIETGWVQQRLKSWTDLNYSLISSLSDEYIKKVNTIVAEGVQQGSTYTTIMADLRAMDKNMSKSRAELIARDQIGKLNGSLSEGRMVDAGVSGYVWFTALDERVRATHRQMSGSENKWEDRSVYKPRGAKEFKSRPSAMNDAIPGSQIQCRCTALPAFDDIIQDVDELITSEEASNPEIATQRRRRGQR